MRKERAIISHIEYVISHLDSVPQSTRGWQDVLPEGFVRLGLFIASLAIYPKGDLIAASIMNEGNFDVLQIGY